MAKTTYCPKCSFEYPANDRVGHCSGCHLTFSGLTSFDAHQAKEYGIGNGLVCISPESRHPDRQLPGKWWIDERGIWHLGERKTSEEIAAIFGK